MPRAAQQRMNKEVINARCCGLDVHKSSITACILIQRAGTREYSAAVWHGNGRDSRISKVAQRVWSYIRRDGKHRGVLEADLEFSASRLKTSSTTRNAASVAKNFSCKSHPPRDHASTQRSDAPHRRADCSRARPPRQLASGWSRELERCNRGHQSAHPSESG